MKGYRLIQSIISKNIVLYLLNLLAPQKLSDILAQYNLAQAQAQPELSQAGLVVLLDPFRIPLHHPFDHGAGVLFTSKKKPCASNYFETEYI